MSQKFSDTDMLNEICKIAEMGRYGISQVIGASNDQSFSDALRRQDAEYEKIYSTAESYLCESGQKPESIGAGAKMGSFVSAKFNTMTDPSTSHIAEMMIVGSASGVAKTVRSTRHGCDIAEKTHKLAEKLLKTEESNIEQMKDFL